MEWKDFRLETVLTPSLTGASWVSGILSLILDPPVRADPYATVIIQLRDKNDRPALMTDDEKRTLRWKLTLEPILVEAKAGDSETVPA